MKAQRTRQGVVGGASERGRNAIISSQTVMRYSATSIGRSLSLPRPFLPPLFSFLFSPPFHSPDPPALGYAVRDLDRTLEISARNNFPTF